METEFKEILDNYIKYFWHKHASVPACFFLKTGDGIDASPCDKYMDSTEAKKILASLIKFTCKEQQADQAALISEVFFVRQKKHEKPNKEVVLNEAKSLLKQYGSLEHVPTRIEAIMVISWSKDHSGLKLWEINRTVQPAILSVYDEFNTPPEQRHGDITFYNPFI